MAHPTQFSAKDLTRRLIAHEAGATDVPHAAAFAAHAACERAYKALVQWIGTNGSELLVSRAIVQARAEHPALANVRVRPRPEPGLDGVAEGIQLQEAGAVAAALEAMLLAMILLLGRLIGEAMTLRVLEPGLHDVARDKKSSRE